MGTESTCQGNTFFQCGCARAPLCISHSGSSDQSDLEVLKTEVISEKSEIDIGTNFEGIYNANSSLFSYSIVPVTSHGTSSPPAFTHLPPNVMEMRFLRLIMKRGGVGFAYCALFSCSFQARTRVESFVT
jgi:hypothetical protein